MLLIVFVLLAKLWQLDEIRRSKHGSGVHTLIQEHRLFEEIKTTKFSTADGVKLITIAINYLLYYCLLLWRTIFCKCNFDY